MPQGKGTYGSQVGRPKKNLHTDPPRGGKTNPKVTPKKKTGQNTKQIQSATAKYGNRMKPTGSTTAKRAGGRVASPVRRAKAPVRGRRSAPTRGGRR